MMLFFPLALRNIKPTCFESPKSRISDLKSQVLIAELFATQA